MVGQEWDGDKLNRKATADFLTQYLTKRYQSNEANDKGFVLAVNADWGFGKTFLVEKWRDDLKNSNDAPHPVVYFDAWRNDFTSEPLVGFITEINEALKHHFSSVPTTKALFEKFIDTGKKLARPAGKLVVEVLLKQIAGVGLEKLQNALTDGDLDEDEDELEENNEDSADHAKNNTKNEISILVAKCVDAAFKEDVTKKKAINTFKKRLGMLVELLEKQQGISLPMFIFIDELDRCRPTYAIELLESIKHLFGVRGVYFVIATNMKQLSHSVAVIYGQNFESERYLKRFFDQEYVLPEPNHDKFASFLFDKYGLTDQDKLYTGLLSHHYPEGSNLAAVMFARYASAFGFGLRDQEQLVSVLHAIALTWDWKRWRRIHVGLLYFLLMLRQKNISQYDQLLRKNMSLDGIRIDAVLNGKSERLIVPHPRDEYNRSGDRKEIAVFDIIKEYLSNIYTDLVKLANREPSNIYNYPASLLIQLVEDELRAAGPRASGQPCPSSLRDYPQVVTQAGQLLV